MLTRKEFTVVLFAFCLASTIFMVIPVSSLGTYDPWLDWNDDGKIDLKDVYATNKAYGTTGDPTKNVTVTNWPDLQKVNVSNLVSSKLDYEVLYLGRVNFTGSGGLRFIANYTGGYSRIGFFATPNRTKYVGTSYTFTIHVLSWFWRIDRSPLGAASTEYPMWNFTITVLTSSFVWAYPRPLTFANQAPYFSVSLYASTDYSQPSAVWVTFDFYAYLRNE